MRCSDHWWPHVGWWWCFSRNWHTVLTRETDQMGAIRLHKVDGITLENHIVCSSFQCFFPSAIYSNDRKNCSFWFGLGRPIRYENRRLCTCISAMVTISIIAIVTCLYVISWWWWYMFTFNYWLLLGGQLNLYMIVHDWGWKYMKCLKPPPEDDIKCHQISYQKLVDSGDFKTKQHIPN